MINVTLNLHFIKWMKNAYILLYQGLPCYFSVSQDVRLSLLHIQNLKIFNYFWPLVVRPNFILTDYFL